MPTTKDRNKAFGADAETAKENTSVEQNDSFWFHEEIEASRWNQSYPYQLFLVKREKGAYKEDNESKKWKFTLPIPPTAISFSMPFAIKGSVQLQGYQEEHGGAPIRNITFTGTTGVLPGRASSEVAAGSRETASFGEAIFGGTLANASRVSAAGNDFAGNFSGASSKKPNILTEDEFETVSKTSGYYQFLLFQRFLENYAAFKMTEKGKPYRLALAMWKDRAVYLVTPTGFQVPRSADSPYEYPYQISFRAWRRISFKGNPPANAFKPVVREANKLGKMLKAIDDARRICETARDTIAAVGGDLDHALFEPLRGLMLFVKDLLGVPVAFADLPVRIVTDAKQSIITAISVQQAADGVNEAFINADAKVNEQVKQIAALGSKTSQVEVNGGSLTGAPNGSTDPANDPFEHPERNYAFFSTLNLSKVNLPPTLLRAVALERSRVRRLNRYDFEKQRNTVQQLAADFADAVGAGHATYTATYGRRASTSTRTPTTRDYQVIFALNRIVMELNRLAASGEINRFQIDAVNYVAGLASRSGIAFTVPKSKFAVPFPYGITLEQLSARYLGSPDRWIEIATLNGLRAPYVDEEGFRLTLLTNGNGNKVVVSDATNLFIGQSVWIGSATVIRTNRRITKIDRISATQHIITVNGDPDLSEYSTLEGAYLHAFLPDTVNSMMTIYIPSDKDPADIDYKTKAIPGLDEFTPLLEAGGVDVLLSDTGDLIITPDGDCRLAIGLQNIIQTAKIRLSVTQGSLSRHPDFGLPIKPGMSTADLDAKQLLEACKNLFADDPTFTGVRAANVQKRGPGVQVSLQIGVRGVSQYLPISFMLPR